MYPGNQVLTVEKIEMYHKEVEIARCGNNVGLKMLRYNTSDPVKVGDVMTADMKLKVVKKFIAVVKVQNLLSEETIQQGEIYQINVMNAKRQYKISWINWIKKSNEIDIDANSACIENSDIAEVVFEVGDDKGALVVTRFDECKVQGRIIAIKDRKLIIYGKVMRLYDNEFYMNLMLGFIRTEIEDKFHMEIIDDIKRLIGALLVQSNC